MKFQIPSSKLQRNFKHQPPNGGRAPVDLELETWSFFGGWILVLGTSQLCLHLI